MNVFSLRRMVTTKSVVHKSRSKRSLIGGSPITDWTEQGASRFGHGIMFLAVCVWVSIAWGFLGLIPRVFLGVGIGGFVITHLMLFVGEMVIHREIPERKKILGILWFPLLCGVCVVFLMWLMS